MDGDGERRRSGRRTGAHSGGAGAPLSATDEAALGRALEDDDLGRIAELLLGRPEERRWTGREAGVLRAGGRLAMVVSGHLRESRTNAVDPPVAAPPGAALLLARADASPSRAVV